MADLFLIPNLLGDTPWQRVLPAEVPEEVASLSFFIVENVRNARRFLKKLVPEADIGALRFYELNQHTPDHEKAGFLKPLSEGNNMGLISEAGCPGVADPGAEIVRMAHLQNIRVIPLVGPSSLLLALMASGLNGQNFAFSGYLPVKSAERIRRIQEIERIAVAGNQTQIFIETPYRNNALLRDLVRICHPSTLLCVAAGITTGVEKIQTKTVSEWRRNLPELDKIPAIFLLGR